MNTEVHGPEKPNLGYLQTTCMNSLRLLSLVDIALTTIQWVQRYYSIPSLPILLRLPDLRKNGSLEADVRISWVIEGNITPIIIDTDLLLQELREAL